MNVESAPAPSRVHGRHTPAAMSAGPTPVTPVQNNAINAQGIAMQKEPKTPPANRLPALNALAGPAAPQLAFSKLAMESSDDIAEIDIPLATVSRKREAAEALQKATENAVASKPPLKRLVRSFWHCTLQSVLMRSRELPHVRPTNA